MTYRRRLAGLFLMCTLALGCGQPAELGQACVDSADCAEDLSCFERMGAEAGPVCMADCSWETTRLCEGGEVCLEVAISALRPIGLGVCQLGGDLAVGATCSAETALGCVTGSICVTVGTTSDCAQACSTDASGQCAEGTTCLTLEGSGTRGYCGTEG